MSPTTKVALLFAFFLVSLPFTRPSFARDAASPLTQLSMHSEQGDYIGQGGDYLFNANDGTFNPSVSTNTAGKVADVAFSFSQGGGGESWNVEFSSQKLGTELVPGTYLQAERAPFADSGHPGLSVFGDSRGSNTLTGKFTVTEAVYDYSGTTPRLVSFAATFEQHSEGAAPALTGTMYYQSNTHPPVADTSHPDTVAVVSGTVGKYGRYAGPAQVTLSATDPDGPSDVAATYYQLDGSAVQTYASPLTITADGIHSVRFYSVDQSGNQESSKTRTVWIDTSPPSSAAALNELVMHSQPGDYIGQGDDFLYTNTDGVFSANVNSYQSYGQANVPGNVIDVTFHNPNYYVFWDMEFSTQQLGTPLMVGTYENAMRSAFTATGHPGLEISGEGRGSNTLTGKFTILDLVLDYSTSATQPQVVSFAANFEQHSEGAAPALTGTIYYQSKAYVGTPSAVTFSPGTVTNGQSTMGTVTLAAAATADETIALTSSIPTVAAVPATVIVPAGRLSVSFPVSTLTVSSQTSVGISASANGVASTGSLIVQPFASWNAAAFSVSLDGASHLLWNNADGRSSGWTIDGSYHIRSTPIFQPGSGWHAQDISTDIYNNTHILWTNADGRMTVWTVNPQGNVTSLPIFQPGGGWAAKALSMDTNGNAHVLWVNPDGRMSVWSITPQGTASSTPIYQPGSGWSAQDMSEDFSGSTHVLWTNTDGRMSVWTINASNGVTSTSIYQPGGGWAANKVSMDNLGGTHVLWVNPDGRMSVWTINEQNRVTSTSIYQPGAGWMASGLDVDANGVSRVLWVNMDGRTSVWTISAGNRVTSTPIYQP